MREHLSNALRGFALAIAAAAFGAVCMALMLALYDIPRTVQLAALPWALLLLALALLCELMTARGANLLIYVAACAALLLAGGENIVSSTAFIPGSSGFPVLLRLLVWASGAACAYAVQKLPSSNAYVRLGDVLIGSVACYLCACFSLNDALISPILTLALCAIAACLLTAAALRAGGESDSVIRGTGAGGMLVMLALLLVCAVLSSALLALASGRVDGLVAFLLAAWRGIVGVISRAFELFVRFIALFAPKPVHYNMAPAQQDSLALSASGIEISARMPQWIIYLFIAFMALLIAGVVLAILWALRGVKLSRPSRKRARRVTRQSHMLAALRARLHALREHISFELAYRRFRRTPEGLYVLAMRRCRAKALKKRPSESPGTYIRRLHGALLQTSGMSTLDALADKLDRALYAGEAVPLSRGESDAFAAQIAALASFEHTKKPASP